MKVCIALAILGFVSQAAASRECGGVIASGVCYFVEYEDFGASRDEAVSYCEDVGGELAVIPSKRAFLRVSAYLVKGYSFQMVLTGMEYDHTESPTRPLLPDGTILPYNPQWFEGHPIRQELHGEIAYLPNSIRKFNGFMNIADGSRYLFFLCSKSLK